MISVPNLDRLDRVERRASCWILAEDHTYQDLSSIAIGNMDVDREALVAGAA